MGQFYNQNEQNLGPRGDGPWTLNVNGMPVSGVSWEAIVRALDRLNHEPDSFVILSRSYGEKTWFLQCAVVLAGPHTGEYTVECGWSGGGEGSRLLAWYGGAAEAKEKFRTVWEGRPLRAAGFEDRSGELPENQRKERLAIACRTVGLLGTNCYFVTDRLAKCTAVIDPGGDGLRLVEELKKLGTQVPYILLTHGHYDHTGAVPELAAAFPEAEIYIHPKDYPGPDSQLFPLYRQLGGMDCPAIRFYKAFNDRDVPAPEAKELPLGELRIHPIHTPGHSEGSVTLRISGGPLFCGDTLFAGSCGRTDFPGGNTGKMMSTLRLFGRMNGDAQVFPGHMDDTTLEEERARNPYLRQALREAP